MAKRCVFFFYAFYFKKIIKDYFEWNFDLVIIQSLQKELYHYEIDSFIS